MCHKRFGLTESLAHGTRWDVMASYLEMDQSLQRVFYSTDTFNVNFSLIVE